MKYRIDFKFNHTYIQRYNYCANLFPGNSHPNNKNGGESSSSKQRYDIDNQDNDKISVKHVEKRKFEKSKRKIVPNAAFPFCNYNGNDAEGVMLEEYNERYCNGFQVIDKPTL